MAKNKTINVKGTEITLFSKGTNDFISLTDIAKHRDLANTDTIIQNWLRNRNTIELLGFWESMYNPNFKPLEFEGFRKQAGLVETRIITAAAIQLISNLVLAEDPSPS